MKIISLIIKEIQYRKVNFLLSVMAAMVAVALLSVFVTATKAYIKETKKIQLGMGQNLRIIPVETSLDKFWAQGFSEYTMPEEYIERFVSTPGFEYTHLTAILQKSIVWKDINVTLTGIMPEVMPPGRNQKPITFSVKQGDVYLGFEIAKILGIKTGDNIKILDKSFKVKKTLSETGSSDDIRIYGHLHDIQNILNLKGRINEIKALECLCLIEGSNGKIDPRILAQEQLKQLLPQAKVLLLEGIAKFRQKQRATAIAFYTFVMPTVLITCGAWIGILAMMNVNQRREEIAIIRALGYGQCKIASLLLGKSIIIGLLAAIGGFFVGTELALKFGAEIFPITATAMKLDLNLLKYFLFATPLFAAISSFIPVMLAIATDPAVILSER